MADSNLLSAFLERIRGAQPEYDWLPKMEQPQGFERKLTACAPPREDAIFADLEAARAELRRRFGEYLAMPAPNFMLLAKTLPGVGKTTAAVEAVEAAVGRGMRVAYAGPRHDFFAEVIAKAVQPWDWYEWRPRDVETCNYPEQVGTWLAKGYQAMDFCAGVCGWDYVKRECIYHRQKRVVENVIYVQHQHVTLGHPLRFDLLIGDEAPIGAFLREWRIPARYVCPPGMDYSEPLTEILSLLAAVAANASKPVMGPALLELLGGAGAVREACEGFELPAGKIAAQTSIHRAEEAEEKPYFHLFELVPLLRREAAAKGPYPQRIIAGGGFLTLLLRHAPANLPEHVIWLDGTGRAEIYKKLFRRDVQEVTARPRLQGRIYQVVDRANGKSTLVARDSEPTLKAQQMKTLIGQIVKQRGYERPAVIGFKQFVEQLGGSDATHGHFYAARGTNEHEAADAVLVAGAPQPNVYDIVKMAKMIFFERERAFEPTWCLKETAYHYTAPDGLGRAYPISGFWRDADLQGVLEMLREDEIIQAGHRGRPVNHAVDIWLLTNIPIEGLPPDELLTMREVMGAPAGVQIFKWAAVAEFVQEKKAVTIADLVAGLGINYETAKSYLERIGQMPGWELVAVRTRHGGKPTQMAKAQSRKAY